MMLRDQPFMREDTFLGVCQSIGDGFRIPSNLLRLAIAPLLIWFPFETVTLYLLAGLLIAVLHWVVPGKRASQRSTAKAEIAPAQEPTNDRDHHVPLAEAA